MANRVLFYINQEVNLLDLAGAGQVFHEANLLGCNYELVYIGPMPAIKSSTGLGINLIMDFSQIMPEKSDIIMIPGFQTKQAFVNDYSKFFSWLHLANKEQATICSICTGAFLLAKSGLLDDKKCTTHWDCTERLQNEFPRLRVVENQLYVIDGNIYSSAGVVSGIDLALHLLEKEHGIIIATTVARELVVYMRRDGSSAQESAYLQLRNHSENIIHLVQDRIANYLDKPLSLDILAIEANCSKRNLTRLFKQHTGLTISSYITKLRVEKAKQLLSKSDYKFDYIARICGLKAKQLRNIMASHPGTGLTV
ncbi:GlxA family transcriptional regulator [Pedobacter sp. L105]|uniref:GlxA family transcriptional regulator n=1 Tax=Pedobacter sp. L105 TaxID=1641871 RepID=UPI00131E5BFE|nr:DJ-1/PfpI family protein [Pedobacter sp. L105]